MRHFKSVHLMVFASLTLGACASPSSQIPGSSISLLSSSTQGAGVRHPKLNGSIIGQGIGSTLDETSMKAALQAEYQALERGKPGESFQWTGGNGVSGFVTPQQTYQVGSQNCRRYEQTIMRNGQQQKASGTACRNPDGSWSALS